MCRRCQSGSISGNTPHVPAAGAHAGRHVPAVLARYQRTPGRSHDAVLTTRNSQLATHVSRTRFRSHVHVASAPMGVGKNSAPTTCESSNAESSPTSCTTCGQCVYGVTCRQQQQRRHALAGGAAEKAALAMHAHTLDPVWQYIYACTCFICTAQIHGAALSHRGGAAGIYSICMENLWGLPRCVRVLLVLMLVHRRKAPCCCCCKERGRVAGKAAGRPYTHQNNGSGCSAPREFVVQLQRRHARRFGVGGHDRSRFPNNLFKLLLAKSLSLMSCSSPRGEQVAVCATTARMQ